MAKWNTRVKSSDIRTLNYEGGVAYVPSEVLELFLRAVSNFVKEPKFYVSAADDFNDLVDAFNRAIEKDPEFATKLVVYTREKMHLRTLPVLGLVIMANHPKYKGTDIVRKVGRRVLTRADMLTEALTMQLALYGKPIPNALKKALRDAITRFDRYQLAKYQCRKCQVKMKDVILLTHPKPLNEEQARTFKEIIEGTLASERTWETIISNQGSTREAWETGLDEWIKYKQLFALLRNLRNLIVHEVDEEKFKQALEILKDPERIRKAKVYPYRYISAYFMIQRMNPETPGQARLASLALKTLSEAMENMSGVLPKFEGNVLVAVDISGSMTDTVSRRSVVRRGDVAAIYGAMLAEKNNADIIVFNHAAEWITRTTVMGTATRISNMISGSTYAYKVLEKALDVAPNGRTYDYMIFITDEQVYDAWGSDRFVDLVNKYRREYNPHMKVIVWDLAGYGDLMLQEHDNRNIYIGGFSEKALDAAKYLEESNKIVEYVKSIEF